MTAHSERPPSHWTDGLTNLPEDARGYFACFALVQNAWNACLNGSWMLRLALELAPDEDVRGQIRDVASEVTKELKEKLDPHLSGRSRERDPVRIAYEDAKSELRMSMGAPGGISNEGSVPEEEQPVYDQSLKELRRMSADLVRAKLPTPTPPSGFVPAAFEDTRVGPSDLAEIARKVKEEAAAEANSTERR
ncbi:MAG: hypothetical protein HUU21_29705 [Polyangiaceae bacterium]|nr:hypothetical protein [Polyangiaceae bacterium]